MAECQANNPELCSSFSSTGKKWPRLSNGLNGLFSLFVLSNVTLLRMEKAKINYVLDIMVIQNNCELDPFLIVVLYF